MVNTPPQVIHAQQLGIKWNAPSEELFASPWAAKETEKPEEGEGELNEEEAAAAQLAERLRDTRFKKLADLLCDEAGFLVDAK
eukprot:8073838-Pyramimonas_sp.AAC.1